MFEEKYYWKNSDGILIPKHDLDDRYICNIVMKYGKDWLKLNGHEVIVHRFEQLNKKYRFFSVIG